MSIGAEPGEGPLRVVAVDPGPTPGVAMLAGQRGRLRASVFQCDRNAVAWLVRRLLDDGAPVEGRISDVAFHADSIVLTGALPPQRVLAVERFVVGPRSARLSTPKAAAGTRDMVGELTALGCGMPGVLVVKRCAAEVMPWATDKRLAAAGLLEITKNMPHARAAARHVLFAAVREGRLSDPLSRFA